MIVFQKRVWSSLDHKAATNRQCGRREVGVDNETRRTRVTLSNMKKSNPDIESLAFGWNASRPVSVCLTKVSYRKGFSKSGESHLKSLVFGVKPGCTSQAFLTVSMYKVKPKIIFGGYYSVDKNIWHPKPTHFTFCFFTADLSPI